MQDIPMLFPVTQVEFWKQMRQLVDEVVEARMHVEPAQPPAAYLPEKVLLKLTDVCEIFQVSKPTVYEWMKQGKIRSFKIRSRRYILRADIESIIQEPRI